MPNPSLPPGVLAGTIGALAKAIYGDQYRNFMGIQDEGTGVQEIQNNTADYNRAYTAEGIVYRLVDIRTKAIAQAPLKVFATDSTGKRTAVDHDALGVIQFGNPNGWVTGESALKKFSLGSLDLQGRVAWQVATSGRGTPTEVYWIPPAAYEPEGDDQGYFKGLKIKGTAGMRERHVPAAALFYHHTVNFEKPWAGTSKIAAARSQINLNLFSLNSNSAFFKNSMRPDWLLTGDWDNTEQNVSLIRRALRRLLGGEANRSPLIIGKNTTAHLLSVNPKDAEWVQQQKLSLEALCAIFGVPLPVYGNLDNGTYANYEQAVATFWNDTMKGDMDDLADGLTRNFLVRWPDARGLQFGFDYNGIRGLSEDINKIWERFGAYMALIDKQVQNKQTTPNQARLALANFADQLGLDSTPWKGNVPGGNTFYLPYLEIPIEQSSLQAVIDVMAARGSNPQLEEDIPGAPHAGANATKPPPASSSGPGKGWTPRVIKAPHPLTVREARLAPIVPKVTGRLKRFFQDQQTGVLRLIRNEKPTKDFDPTEPLWDKQDAYNQLELMIHDAATQAAMTAYGATSEDFGVDVRWDESEDNPFLKHYLGPRLNLIRGIDDTTEKQLRATLQEGYGAGEGIPALSERVKSVYRDAIDNRAETIARTETINAYAAASLDSYQQAGITHAQMYDGHGDPECAAVDGMIVTLAEARELMAAEHPNGTRGVAPIVGVPDTVAASAPIQPALSKAHVAAIADFLTAAAEQSVAKDAQRQRELSEALMAIKALAGREIVVTAPDVRVKVDVPTPGVTIEEGAVQVHLESPVVLEAGSVQAITNVQQAPEPEDVEIEWDNFSESGKPVRIRRRH